jgi:hypothetical protein
MSCWVVPTIAAEIWGVSVDHVLSQVRDGHLPHQLDEGFMFVDVFSHGGGGGCGVAKQVEPPPPTFIVLSEAEVEALGKADEEPRVDPIDDSGVEEETESQSPDDDEASVDLGDWRAARQRVGRTRIPPGARTRAA